MANIKQNLMQPNPSADDQERMRMCKFCVHGHISDLGYNHCWQSDIVTCDGCSPMGICSAFRDKREWKPYYIAHLTTEYRGNICWVKAVRNSPVKGKSRIFKYEIIDPVASTKVTLTPKEFVKAYIPATPDSKPPYQMEEYEKWDAYCFGTCNPQLTEEQNARNNHEAHWQEILAQEAIDKQIKNEK